MPPYSPTLNLIERLWKLVKKHCLYSKYYEKVEPFKQAVSDCLALTSTKYKNELKSWCSSANTLIMRKPLIHKLLHDKGPSVQVVDIECLILNQNISG